LPGTGRIRSKEGQRVLANPLAPHPITILFQKGYELPTVFDFVDDLISRQHPPPFEWTNDNSILSDVDLMHSEALDMAVIVAVMHG
jgi:hypothetical protein